MFPWLAEDDDADLEEHEKNSTTQFINNDYCVALKESLEKV